MELWALGMAWHQGWVENSKNLGLSQEEQAMKAAFADKEQAFKEAVKGKKVLIDFEKYLLYVTDNQRRINGRIIRHMARFGAQITWLKKAETSRDVFVLACIGANVAVDLEKGNIELKKADIIVA